MQKKKKFVDMPFTERIKTIIGLSDSADKLARSAGMSGRAVGQYLSGNSDPTRRKLIALANAARVHIKWLATGQGPMSINDGERIDVAFLEFLFEICDEFERSLKKPLSPGEKAWLISEVHASDWRTYYTDRSDFVGQRFIIRLHIEELHSALRMAHRITNCHIDPISAEKEIVELFKEWCGDSDAKNTVGILFRLKILNHPSTKKRSD